MQDVSPLSRMFTLLKLDQTLLGNNTEHYSYSELSLDSRTCDPHTIFIAVIGETTQGHNYIEQAQSKGCTLCLAEVTDASAHNTLLTYSTDNICVIGVYQLNQKLGELAKCFHFGSQLPTDFPKLSAITGTNGKTSVATISAQLTSLLGHSSASIGTLGVYKFERGEGAKIALSANTTPDVLSLFSALHTLYQSKVQYVFIEASSHGLQQGRLHALEFTVAVFTNLSQDHLDYHRSMREYAAAKRRLLDVPGLTHVVVNGDDSESEQWQQQAQHLNVLSYSKHELASDVQGCFVQNLQAITGGLRGCLQLRLPANNQHYDVNIPLFGEFNLENTMASLLCLYALGLDIKDTLVKLPFVRGVAGRMELFESPKANIIVDFAHTPDALNKALLASKAHLSGSLTCIFGCGGERDTGKRPQMGKIASELADSIVITQDNSRTEAPQDIFEDILAGVDTQHKAKVTTQIDRKQAIIDCWTKSQNTDLILLAGKGHEEYLDINNVKIPYNEREFVQQMIATESASAINTMHQTRVTQ